MREFFNRTQHIAAVCLLLLPWAGLFGQITAEPASLELGRRKPDEVIAVAVQLANQGKSDIEILAAHSDCSCSAATPGRRQLAPGETTLLEITIETRNYVGPLQRRIRVETSAGDLVVPITLNVSPYEHWAVSPTTPVLPRSEKGQEASTEVWLSYTGSGRAEILRFGDAPSWLTATAKSQEDGRSVAITLTKRADAPAGNHAVKLVAYTNDPVDPELTFNVFVPVTSALRIAPNPVVLPTVKVGQVSTREVVLHGWSEEAAPRLVLSDGEAKVVDREGPRVTIEVNISPSRPGPLTQLLRVFAGSRLEFEVPVILRAQAPDRE